MPAQDPIQEPEAPAEETLEEAAAPAKEPADEPIIQSSRSDFDIPQEEPSIDDEPAIEVHPANERDNDLFASNGGSQGGFFG